MQISPALKKRIAKKLLLLLGCGLASVTIEAEVFTPPPQASSAKQIDVSDIPGLVEITPYRPPAATVPSAPPIDLRGIEGFTPLPPLNPTKFTPPPPDSLIPTRQFPPTPDTSPAMILAVLGAVTAVGSLFSYIAIRLYRRIRKISVTVRPIPSSLKLTPVLCALIFSAAFCGTAIFIYNDYQSKEAERIRQQSIQQAENAARITPVFISPQDDGYELGAARYPNSFTPPSSRFNKTQMRDDAILQEMRRANDLAEQANEIAEDSAFQQSMRSPLLQSPQRIVVEPDPMTRFQNQQALDEIRRMRELQEDEQLRRNLRTRY